MVLVSGSPQNAESRCVIEDTWSSILSTEVLFSRNYLCLGRKNSKEVHFPPYWHSSLDKVNVTQLQGANHHPCPRLFQSAWTVAFPSPAHSRAEALPCWCKARDSRDWSDPNISPVSAGPFQSRFKLCFPTHTSPELRSCPQIPVLPVVLHPLGIQPQFQMSLRDIFSGWRRRYSFIHFAGVCIFGKNPFLLESFYFFSLSSLSLIPAEAERSHIISEFYSAEHGFEISRMS